MSEPVAIFGDEAVEEAVTALTNREERFLLYVYENGRLRHYRTMTDAESRKILQEALDE